MSANEHLRASSYATLALAAICLGFADAYFLRWMPVVVVVTLSAFCVAWRNEGKWHLSESAANTVGVVIAFGILWWIIFRVPTNDFELAAAGVPWPACLLPPLAPLLMILTAVKLFRPKTVSDYWSLHILGVMMVTLASILAGDPEHVVWVFLYLLALVWGLAVAYPFQLAWRRMTPFERRTTPLFATAPVSIAPRRLDAGRPTLRAALVWASMVAAFGGIAFFALPRSTDLQWSPHRLSAASASAAATFPDAGMDLNRTGPVELSDEIAFEATAFGPDRQPRPISFDAYWRGETLEVYQNGRWHPAHVLTEFDPDINLSDGDPDDAIRMRVVWPPDIYANESPFSRPEDAPPDKIYLAIRVLAGLDRSLVLAEPVDVAAGVGLFPRIGERVHRSGLFTYFDGSDALSVAAPPRHAAYTYGQYVDGSVDPASQLAGRMQKHYVAAVLSRPPDEAMVAQARNLVERVAGLSADARRLDAAGRVSPADHEAVSRAIAQHFSGSGEFLYSLNRRRVDRSLDPNVDFLRNVKEGHCERYASALALVLRGLGIPCRVVRGFHGAEMSDDGVAFVRLNQAHSWVQALVPDGDGFRWILLDPTPGTEAPKDRWFALLEWAGDAARWVRAVFRQNVLEYNSDFQSSQVRAWFERTRSIRGWMIGLTIVALAAMGGRILVRRWRETGGTAATTRLAWMELALTEIRRLTGKRPDPGQTLAEFAATVAPGLSDSASTAFATLVAHAYRVRFAGLPLNPAEAADVGRCLAVLRKKGVGSLSFPS